MKTDPGKNLESGGVFCSTPGSFRPMITDSYGREGDPPVIHKSSSQPPHPPGPHFTQGASLFWETCETARTDVSA